MAGEAPEAEPPAPEETPVGVTPEGAPAGVPAAAAWDGAADPAQEPAREPEPAPARVATDAQHDWIKKHFGVDMPGSAAWVAARRRELAAELTGLGRQVRDAGPADPGHRAALIGAAKDAGAHLKAGDLAAAEAGAAALRRMLADGPAAAPAAAPAADQAGADAPAAPGAGEAAGPAAAADADAMMRGVDRERDARAAGGPPEGVQVAQAVLPGPFPLPLPAGAAPSLEVPHSADAAATKYAGLVGRRLSHVGHQVLGGHILGALGQVFTPGRPFPAEVDDPDPRASERTGPRPPGMTEDGRMAVPAAAAPDGGQGDGAAAMTAADPGRFDPAPAPPPPLALLPEGFDIHPDAGKPTVVGTPPPDPSLVPNHTGSPPPAVNLGDLREEFPALPPQGPDIMAMAAPTPRNGVVGGKPAGKPTDETKGRPDVKRSHRRENEALRQLAKLGYQVEQNPARQEHDNNKPSTRPDARIGGSRGSLFDVYSPRTDKMDNMRDEMSDKVPEQADRLIVNLKDTNKTVADLERMLIEKPIKGLKELLAIDKQGKVFRLFPNPGPVE